MSKKISQNNNQAVPAGDAPKASVFCSSCGALIRANADVEAEQMCLICHARMLNEYFHDLKKRSDEKRERLAASE